MRAELVNIQIMEDIDGTEAAFFMFEVDSDQMTSLTVTFTDGIESGLGAKIVGVETVTHTHHDGNINMDDMILSAALLNHLAFDKRDGMFEKNSIFKTQKIGTVINVIDC